MRNLIRITVVFCLTALLCSCASVSVVDTWRNPTLPASRLHKVLVVSFAAKAASRAVYENMLVSELNKHGVEAVASYSVLSQATLPDWHALDRAVRSVGAQGILAVQTIKLEKQATVQPGAVGTPYPGYWYPPAFPDWDFPGYYRSMALYGPSYVTTYDVATMQVNLFDLGSDRLLWAGTMQTMEPENVTKVGKDLAYKVVKSLKKEGLI
ncbi:DUF4136 domain-containing protein [Geomonas subterranea]|uniref:DUF4136 domain-containing protein n=1 Tax=Geomonas subterranea TaxID=2847989 RepID=A0ABX8LJY8_9BACT|nr:MULTISPECIES: DUF4136 domain-containing protein [Geomonas]QXE92012.1 DUF4136 domain-containing protein [Geomonas subterranea]QXM09895.1 DUF4136 domain-containing protein [Geomonas subterranea]